MEQQLFLDLSYGPNNKIQWPMEFCRTNGDEMKFRGKSATKVRIQGSNYERLGCKDIFNGRKKQEN